MNEFMEKVRINLDFLNSGFFKKGFLGNSIGRYIVALAVLLVGFMILKVIKTFVVSKLKKITEKTKNNFDDFLLEFFEKTLFPVLDYGVFYLSIIQLNLNVGLLKLVYSIGIIFLSIQFTRFFYAVLEYIIHQKWDTAENSLKTTGVMTFIKILFGCLCALFILDNLGFNISTVIAGLGVGGVAIALASQNILNDLFNHFVIFFDKPFEIGDFIIVGEYAGSIKHIGIKTTRISSISGEEIVFSNSDLTGSRIKNYKRMEKRRIVFEIGVVYGTPKEQIAEIPNIIKNIIEKIENVEFSRSHFKNFAAYSMNFETVYFVLGNDFGAFRDIQQIINNKIYQEFEDRKIEFAYPTQTLFINKES
ncbi:MAG: mechanosensitive ion channel family protein [Candidatus Muirbacterium halophilum]|nr:mechanosensitive ion channel family protein [Candidatus Muirbacterium halophilum]MCK9476702.1 mechanosensitive ion channel family protein [Candidatus Muirbacterium halophilum]